MCRLCEGASREDLLAETETAIAVHGYTMQGVADDEHQPWVYTIGLLDAADHPELIVAGASPETSARIISAFADAVIEGERYAVGDVISAAGRSVRVGAVHEIQYALDTFNSWHWLRDAGVLHAPQLAAVQIILGKSFFCADHQAAQPRLSDPDARVGEPLLPLNRAARRSRGRGRPRDR